MVAADRHADGRHARRRQYRVRPRPPLLDRLHARRSGRSRFFCYLSLFTFAMLMLVTSATTSCRCSSAGKASASRHILLIGFWYHKPSANAAAMKAFIVNRVGDFGFALGIFGVFFVFNSISFDTVFRSRQRLVGKTFAFLGLPGRHPNNALPSCCSWARWVSRRSSCCTPGCRMPWKARRRSPRSSTQPPWSPLASSWSRACRRCSNTPHSRRDVVLYVGTMTALVCGNQSVSSKTTSNASSPIRPAPSSATCSPPADLALMALAIFHLFTHAFFKALLVPWLRLGDPRHAPRAGHAQHGRAGPQDPPHLFRHADRHAGADRRRHSALIGFAGFHSKDAIIEAPIAGHTRLQLSCSGC
jgi:NADH-quinone oxidoreductase subunit L